MKRYMSILFVIAVLVFTNGIASADLNDGLVAYYPFNGNANDESGNGYNGTVYGATLTYDRFGNPNSAYSFNNDYIYIGLFNISVPVTVSVWFKSPQTNDQWDTILGWNSDIDPFNGISIQANGDGDIRARIGSEHNDAISTIKTIDGDNYWHNITITKKVSDNTVILYVDGTANISAIANDNIGTWHNLYFGRSFRPVSWDEYFIGSIDDVRIYNRVLSASEIQQLYQEGDSQHLNFLYYPHVASGGTWETEICAINTGSENIEGVFRAYTDEGISASDDIAVALGAYERREITVGEEFTDPSSIGYIIFESDSENVVGYTKFYILGKYRAALPAVSQPNSGDFYIPHVASNSAWWTGVGLVNTNSSARQLTFTFNNGMTRAISLAPKEHKSLTIGSLFGGQTPADIESATVTGGDGVVGLELFGSTEASGMNYLSGVLLKDSTATNIYYPHVATNSPWWTGIVAYNPSGSPCTITVHPYTQNGSMLQTQTIDLQGKSKYIGTVSDLSLPAETAWFGVEASSPITGFELFGTSDGNQLAGYTGVGISGTDGVFAKIEKDGWTGIAFVNIENSSAVVTITAYDDSGNVIGTETLNINAYEKVVHVAQNLFSQDISDATYIGYSSDGEVVGFQLNGSSDDMMLDALPGM